MALTYDPIATTTASGSTTSITFNSISGSYTDLRLVINANLASGADNVGLRFNSDTGTNYSRTGMAGNGIDPFSARNTNATSAQVDYYGYLDTTISMMTADIMNYANSTTYKTVLGRSSNANNGTGVTAGLWRNTNAITSITVITTAGTNFASGSTFTLYGIKAA